MQEACFCTKHNIFYFSKAEKKVSEWLVERSNKLKANRVVRRKERRKKSKGRPSNYYDYAFIGIIIYYASVRSYHFFLFFGFKDS